MEILGKTSLNFKDCIRINTTCGYVKEVTINNDFGFIAGYDIDFTFDEFQGFFKQSFSQSPVLVLWMNAEVVHKDPTAIKGHP